MIELSRETGTRITPTEYDKRIIRTRPATARPLRVPALVPKYRPREGVAQVFSQGPIRLTSLNYYVILHMVRKPKRGDVSDRLLRG